MTTINYQAQIKQWLGLEENKSRLILICKASISMRLTQITAKQGILSPKVFVGITVRPVTTKLNYVS